MNEQTLGMLTLIEASRVSGVDVETLKLWIDGGLLPGWVKGEGRVAYVETARLEELVEDFHLKPAESGDVG